MGKKLKRWLGLRAGGPAEGKQGRRERHQKTPCTPHRWARWPLLHQVSSVLQVLFPLTLSQLSEGDEFFSQGVFSARLQVHFYGASGDY